MVAVAVEGGAEDAAAAGLRRRPARKTIAPAPSPNSTTRWRKRVFQAKSSAASGPGSRPSSTSQERWEKGIREVWTSLPTSSTVRATPLPIRASTTCRP